MRDFFRSMTGRIFLILLIGIVSSAAATYLIAVSESGREFTGARTEFAVQRVQQLVLSLEAVQSPERPALVDVARAAGLTVTLGPASEPRGETDATLARGLEARLGRDRDIRATTLARSEAAAAEKASPDTAPSWQDVRMNLRDGTPLTIEFAAAPRRRLLPHQRQLIAWAVFVLCIAGLAFAVARLATRPLRRLSQAADALGSNIDRPPLDATGPVEVRHAAVAFNSMQARIRHHVQERTQMLAAITHDLQTPVTRLRLRIEQVTDERLRVMLASDLAGIQAMSQEGLELARSMESSEPMQTLDLDSLLDSVCADAEELGQKVTLKGRVGAPVRGRPVALRRCLTNLVDNAVKYGEAAEVTATRSGNKAVISVRDRGPGIPEEFLEAVFEPFRRVETSRSRETGGTGIGLTIARAIAERHGGTLTLRNHPEGGLEAVLQLPIGR